MLIHPVIAKLSEGEVSAFINLMSDESSSEDCRMIEDSDLPLKDSFLSVLSSYESVEIGLCYIKNVSHISKLEISSGSQLTNETQQIVKYLVKRKPSSFFGVHIYGYKSTLLHYKSLDLYIMIVNIDKLFHQNGTNISRFRKVLSCYYYLAEDIEYKNTGKMYMVKI